MGVKGRLGPKLPTLIGSTVLENQEKVEIFEYSDLDSEEEHLRANAIKTIDLRNRLSTKDSDEEKDER